MRKKSALKFVKSIVVVVAYCITFPKTWQIALRNTAKRKLKGRLSHCERRPFVKYVLACGRITSRGFPRESLSATPRTCL